MTREPGPLKYWLSLNDSGVWGDDPMANGDTPVVRSTDIRVDGSWDLHDVAQRSLEASDCLNKRLIEGDLVVVKSSGSAAHLGKTAIVDRRVAELRPCFANFVQRLRTTSGAYPRFVWYLLDSRSAASEMELLGSTTTGLRNLNGSIIASVTFPGLSVPEQRDIAVMYRTDFRRPIMYGIVLPGPDAAEGVPIVKGGDVAAGRLCPSQLCRTTRDIEKPYARARLQSGDLLFAIRGGIGDVQVVPPELQGANITQDVARVAPAGDVDSHWLKTVLQTMSVVGQVAARTTGATIRGLNICELKRVRISWSDESRQRRDLEILTPAASRRDSLVETLTRQIALLQERRQALITAAVTGELEIPGAA